MGGMFSYSGIATKTRAMGGKLLTKEDFASLASAASVADAVSYLKQHTAYADVLSEVTEGNLHRGDIERVLIKSLYQDFSKIYRFCNLKQRSILELYFCKYEIQVLKRALRRIFHPGQETMRQVAKSQSFRSYSSIDMEKLNGASDIPELLEAVKKTSYYEVLLRLSKGEKQTLFDYEMVLDLFYFSNIWKQKGKYLKKNELADITRIYGSQIDMLNMMWIYRAKHYYQIPSASIYMLVIPIFYKLKKEQIQQMVDAENEKSLEDAVSRTYYGKRNPGMKEADLEILYRQLLKRIYQSEKRKHPYSIIAVTSYLYDKEEEIDQLTTILECVRYGLMPAEAMAYIPFGEKQK